MGRRRGPWWRAGSIKRCQGKSGVSAISLYLPQLILLWHCLTLSNSSFMSWAMWRVETSKSMCDVPSSITLDYRYSQQNSSRSGRMCS